MSKVVHLSDPDHQMAKVYCRDRNLCMSTWVGKLIQLAAKEAQHDAGPTPESSPTGTQRPFSAPNTHHFNETHAKHLKGVEKKARMRLESDGASEDAAAAVYTAPPFWARS